MTDKTLIVLLEGQRIGVLQENAAGKHSFIYDKHAPGAAFSIPAKKIGTMDRQSGRSLYRRRSTR